MALFWVSGLFVEDLPFTLLFADAIIVSAYPRRVSKLYLVRIALIVFLPTGSI
jgi:hypothetical protein